jgi:putative ABC transport system substrate-binding protein
MARKMQRRMFLTLLATSAAWPLAVRAQQDGRVRRVAMLMGLAADDAEARASVAAFQRGLRELGWFEGTNLQIEYRYAAGEIDATDAAAELVAFRPEVIVARSSPMVAALLRATRTIPIVFTVVGEPITSNFVASNATGISLTTQELEGKRLGLLRDLLPAAEIIGVLTNPTNPTVEKQVEELQEGAHSIGRQLQIVNATTDAEIDRAFVILAQQRVRALVVPGEAFFYTRRNQIATLAAHYAIPTFYSRREFTEAGGLISYGPTYKDMHRLTGVYVDRILKGEKPADLPVVQPTKYELVINLRTAKRLNLDIPPSVLAIVDKVIE